MTPLAAASRPFLREIAKRPPYRAARALRRGKKCGAGVAKQVMRHQASHFTPSDPGAVPWRRRRLEHAGFQAELAQRLAGDRRFDLHAVLELIDRGCPPELAARILAPLDDPPEAPR